MKIEDAAQIAENEIAIHESAGVAHAMAARQEILVEAGRSALKNRLASALIGTPNAATNRNHSAESAKDAASASEEYLAHVQQLSDAVHAKNCEETRKKSAYLRASLAVALVKSEAGVL